MAQEAPQPQDVLDFQFKLQCRLKVFKNESNEEFGKVCNLVATASRFGLVFVGTASKQFQVIRIEDIEELVKDVESYPCRVIEIPSKPRHLSVNCDGTKLCVVVERDECPTAIFYDVLSFLKEQVKVIKEIRLSATPKVDVIQTEWNPALPNVFTACKSDGLLGVYEFKDASLDIKELPAGAEVTCFCWSPKGKQLAVGNKTGKITQHKPDLKVVRVINEPPLGGKTSIVSLMWVSSFQMIGIYKKANSNDSFTVIVVDAPKTGEMVYTNYDDICYSYGNARPSQFYMILEQHWNVLMVASSNSMEVGVLGIESDKWLQWILGDSSRAELPLCASKQDTFPIGCALNTSTTRDVASWEKTQAPESPMLLLMSHQGQLCCFYTVNLKKGVPSACSPMEKVDYNQNLFKKMDGKQEPIVSSSSALKPLLPTPTFHQPVVTAQMPRPVTNLSAQPVATTQMPRPVINLSAQPGVTTQPLRPFINLQAQPPQPVINLQSQQPVTNLQSQQIPISLQSQQPAISLQSQQPPISLQSQQPAISLQSQQPPISLQSQQPVITLQSQQPSFGGGSMTAKTSITTEPSEQMKTPTKRSQDGKLVPSKETDSMIAELIREECLTLDAEIKALLHSCREINVFVGSDSEATQMVQQCNALQEFLQALKETSSGQTAEIHTLKQTVIQTWAWYEEARSRFQTSQDPMLMKVMQGRPLDPASQQQLEDINHSTYYLDSQLLQANKCLDEQWESFQDSLSKNKKVQLPTMEAIYQSMVRQNATLQKQRYVLKDISSRIQSHRRRYQTNASNILISLEKVDDLQEELENLTLLPEESTPQIRYKKIIERQKKLTKEKCDKLFKFFSNREVTHVSVVKPQLNNTTVQLNTLLAAPLSPIALEKKVQPVKKADIVMSTPKPPTHHGKNLTAIFEKNTACPTSTPMVKSTDGSSDKAPLFEGVTNKNVTFNIKPQSATTPTTIVNKPAFVTPTTVVSKSTFSYAALTSGASTDNKTSGFITPTIGNKIGTGFSFTNASQGQIPTGLTITPVPKSETSETTNTGTQQLFGMQTPASSASSFFGKPATSQPKLGVTPVTSSGWAFGQKSTSASSNLPAPSTTATATTSPFNLNTNTPVFNLTSSAAAVTVAPFTVKTTSNTATTSALSFNVITTTSTSPFFTATTGSLFSSSTASTTTAGIFGSTQPSTTSSLFGSSTGGIFGTAGSLFGAATIPSTSSNAISSAPTITATTTTTATSSLFGSVATASTTTTAGIVGFTQPSTTGVVSSTTSVASGGVVSSSTGLFGAKVASTTASVAISSSATPVVSTAVNTTSIFGGATSTIKSTAAVTTAGSKSIFGFASTMTSTPSVSSTSSVFGNVSIASTTSVPSTVGVSSASVFGTVATSSKSIFGGSVKATTAASPFTAISTSVFASTPSTTVATTPVTSATSVFGTQPTVSTAVTTATTSANSIFGSKPATNIFGSATTTSTTSVFGSQPTTTTSVFGSTATTTQSVFSGFNTATTTASVFGGAATAATTTVGFGATTTTSSFGSPFTTQTSSVFGGGDTTSPFGAVQASPFSGFGTASTASGPVFGQPAAFGSTTSSGGIFGGGANTATSSVFGSGSTTNTFGSNAGVFGTASTAASPFRAGSAFGTTTNTNSPFGAAASTAASPFAQAASTFGSAPSFGSGFGSGGNNFGFNNLNVGSSTATTTTASSFGGFGQAAQNPFGRGTTSTSGSIFGTPSTTTSASIFGTPSTTSTSSVFGATSPFNKPAAPAFGSPPSFGQPPAFGQSAFGQAATFGGSPGFGGTGAFSGGGQTIQQTGFGSPAFQKPASGFGSGPVFGSPTPAFGSPPSFGGASTFGGAGTFGSPQKVFGTPTTESSFGNVGAQSPTFGNLANQNTLGFGNLAQQAASPPAPQTNTFSGGSSFSSWR